MGEQPIFTCKAHVFHIDRKTKRSWVPASTSAVNVSFFYDSSRSLYRIISVEGSKAVINSTIMPNMTFTKTSQKFGQWSDFRAGTVYGLGFASETELNEFIEKFQDVTEATKNSKVPASTTISANGSTPTTTSINASPIMTRSSIPPNVIKSSDVQSDIFSSAATSTPMSPAQAQRTNMIESNLLNKTPQQQQAINHQRSLSLSGLQQQPLQDSPKKGMGDVEVVMAGVSEKLLVPNPPLTGESQLKYENDRLKHALAQSSANAKKWEVELSTLKNNNTRLTCALQESTSNVEEWKRQLHSYKEENTRLKIGFIELEAGRGNCDFNVMSELRNLKSRINEIEGELREKDLEITILKEQISNSNKLTNGDENVKTLCVENDTLRKTLENVQCQLDTSLDSQDHQRKVLESISRQFGDHVHSLGQLHHEFQSVLNT